MPANRGSPASFGAPARVSVRAMSHVVMQAAQFVTLADAARVEEELQRLRAAYISYEQHADSPWSADAVPAPLVELGARHGVPWPGDKDSRFFLKGAFDDAAEVLRIDRLVFFWGGGFDLGGEWLREVLRKLGAVFCTDLPRIVVRVADPHTRVAEASEFLIAEDYEDQFSTDDALDDALFTITFANDTQRTHLVFDDSGVQDWAFVAMLPQLSGDDPVLQGPHGD